MRGKALYFTLFSIFYCGCNQPKSIHISRFGCKGTKFQWIETPRGMHFFILVRLGRTFIIQGIIRRGTAAQGKEGE